MDLPYDVLLIMLHDADYITLLRIEGISKHYHTFIELNPQLFHWKAPKYTFTLRDLFLDNRYGNTICLRGGDHYPRVTLTLK